MGNLVQHRGHELPTESLAIALDTSGSLNHPNVEKAPAGRRYVSSPCALEARSGGLPAASVKYP